MTDMTDVERLIMQKHVSYQALYVDNLLIHEEEIQNCKLVLQTGVALGGTFKHSGFTRSIHRTGKNLYVPFLSENLSFK